VLSTRLLLAWAACLGTVASLTADDTGFRVPDGFEVSLFADDDLATNIYTLTVDHLGQVVVSGPGYVKRLLDDNGDGLADRAETVFDGPASGAKGLLFTPEGHLIFTGDNGLWLVRDNDGDGRCEAEPERWATLRHPEHGANGLVWGPDGHVWLICGNDAGVDKQLAGPGSPVPDPQCGAVIRFTPDGQSSTVYAHGFRNPYDLVFGPDGHLFTVDSDGEREHKLPWYTPTRLFDIGAGRHHGWIESGWTKSWAPPAYFFDNVPRVAEIGRGSPTGLFVTQHPAWPARYRNGVFSLCWTYGRVYFFPLERQGSTFTSDVEVFMETVGDVGFAPVDAELSPSGDVFLAIGGRGTRGSVFRLRPSPRLTTPVNYTDPIAKVLQAPQPLSPWSRKAWIASVRELGREVFANVIADPNRAVQERVRAIEILVDVFQNFGAMPLDWIAQIESPEVRARLAWATLTPDRAQDRKILLQQFAQDKHPRVLRAAWEGLIVEPLPPEASPEIADRALAESDRYVSGALIRAFDHPELKKLAERIAKDKRTAFQNPPTLYKPEMTSPWLLDGQAASRQTVAAWTQDEPHDPIYHYLNSSRQYNNWPGPAVHAVRRLQVELGAINLCHAKGDTEKTSEKHPEVLTGYVSTLPHETIAPYANGIERGLTRCFPSGDRIVDLEIARTLGMIHRGLIVSQKLTSQSDPQDDIHYLIVMALSEGQRTDEVTSATARALAGLHAKYAEQDEYPSDKWPERIGELFDLLVKKDPALPEALVEVAAFGRAEHTLFAQRLPKELKERAAEKLFAEAARRYDEGEESDLEPAFTPELIRLVAGLPAEKTLPILRELWTDLRYRDDVTLVLTRHKQPEDRERLVESLKSTQFSIVAAAAEALLAMSKDTDKKASPESLAAALVGLRRQSGIERGSDATDPRLLTLVQQWSEQLDAPEAIVEQIAATAEKPSPQAIRDAFIALRSFLVERYPEESASLVGLGGQTAEAWSERLAKVDWDAGRVAEGKIAFERAACHKCHDGRSRLGPELKNVGSRFSRADLFAAILEPSRDVSPTYHTTIVRTKSGKTYVGMTVYQSPDGTLLQTGPGETARINGPDILVQEKGSISLMPTGLLDEFDAQSLADLYAYLKTIR
jgi:putative heme-binding domain-containing protein